jgi:hypothetical protein
LAGYPNSPPFCQWAEDIYAYCADWVAQNIMRHFILPALLVQTLAVASCHDGQQLTGIQTKETNPLSFLKITLEHADELGGGKALSLTVHNPSSSALSDVVIGFDGTYTAALQDLQVYLGFWEGSPALDRSNIQAEELLSFTFSYDTPNHHWMKDPSGGELPRDLIPSSIEITCNLGGGSWKLDQN